MAYNAHAIVDQVSSIDRQLLRNFRDLNLTLRSKKARAKLRAEAIRDDVRRLDALRRDHMAALAGTMTDGSRGVNDNDAAVGSPQA